MKHKISRERREGENDLCFQQHLLVPQIRQIDGPQASPSRRDVVQFETGAIPQQVQVALATVGSFSAWRKRLQDGCILAKNGPLTVEACKEALLDDFDNEISHGRYRVPLWRQPSHGRVLLPRPCHELLEPSSQRIILCDVLDTRVSILQRLPADRKWVCVETGKGGEGDCSHFTHETLVTDIPESMDADPVTFAKETVFYSNAPFPANCEQLTLRFLPRVREFVSFAGFTTLHLTFQALTVLIPTISGVLLRRIPSLGLAAWLHNASEYAPIDLFCHETVREVVLSGEQHWQESLDETLLPSQLEPVLDAYSLRLKELFPDGREQFACGGWLAARMFRDAFSRNGFDYCQMPPEKSLSLWPILLDSYTKAEEQ